MKYPSVKLFLNILLVFISSLVFGGSAMALCSDLTPQQILRDDVLIVVNDNSISSPVVGDYYCEKRRIDSDNIARVHVPVTNDVELDQFISLRDQLIKHMQENTLSSGVVPVVCDVSQGYTRFYCPESVEQLNQTSSIRYLVMTKGLPIRFRFTGSTLGGNREASVDNYLRFWLSNYFSQDEAFDVNFNDRAIDFGDGRGMRPINTKIDRELIVGRIDGVDTDSAKRLVDRAINAEKNGIFGKLYGNKFGGNTIRKSLDEGAFWKKWKQPSLGSTSNTEQIYPKGTSQAGWHYLHGLFGEIQGLDELTVRHTTNPDCASHDASGRIPKQCVVAVNLGASSNVDDNPIIKEDLPPGTPSGRIPSPDNALMHQGYFDTFSSLLEFDDLLNWRDNATCKTLCSEALDVAGCIAASTDAYEEINTSCVRVADGYMGYTFNSYPVGMMASWPTGWYQSVSYSPERFDTTGGQHYYFWQPEVRDVDGNFSLWYRNSDEKSTAFCYQNSNEEAYQALPDGGCKLDKKISINQKVDISERAINLASPQTIRVQFKYRGIGLNRNVPVTVGLTIRESTYDDGVIKIGSSNQVLHGFVAAPQLIATNDPLVVSTWKNADVTFTLDPDLHQHPQHLYNGIRISVTAGTAFEGEFAFDDFSLEEDGINIPLVNPSFNDGHRQLSGGDSAATFLSRMNGTAFWGNISHHEFDGHSFERNPYETLIYFLRGLPLGDAVWFAEFHNSGILYGDPIYSPIAIHLDYLSAFDNRAPDDHFNIATDSPLALTGDTQNGTGADVTSTYSIDYCSGNDFFLCDQNGGSWIPISNMQNRPGGQRDKPLGDWDISNFDEGDYVLRLAVTTTNSTKGLTQTFYDYYDISMYSPVTTEDFDSDGLSYQDEIAAGTNPWNNDTDSDGLPDGWEVDFGVDALSENTNADSDGDGVTDAVEFIRGTNPSDDQSKPNLLTFTVDSVNGVDNDVSPFETVGAAISSAQAGDTVLLLSGKHNSDAVVVFTDPIFLRGESQESTIFKPQQLINNAVVGAIVVSDLAINSANIIISSNADNSGWQFKKNSFKADIRTNKEVPSAIAQIEFENNVFSGASGDAINIIDNSDVVLRNNTLTGNNIGVRASENSEVKIINSIISGNTNADVIGVQQADISYSLISDGSFVGVNNIISGDPQFLDSQNDDYHLKPESPAIDSGDPQSDFSQEPTSVIKRINLGRYGNTREATVAAAGNGGGTEEPQGSSSGQIDSLLLLWFSLFGFWRIYYKHNITY